MVRTVAVTLIATGFIYLIAFIAVNSKTASETVSRVALPENHIFFDGVKLVRSTGAESHFVLNAGTAYLNKNMDSVTLQEIDAVFIDPSNKLVTKADHGVYVIDKSLRLRGRISGDWNDMSYYTKDNGTFIYNLEESTGTMFNNVVAVQDGSYIEAGKLNYDSNRNLVDFTGGVVVNYLGENL